MPHYAHSDSWLTALHGAMWTPLHSLSTFKVGGGLYVSGRSADERMTEAPSDE